MKEIKVKDNPLGIRVYAVGEPDIDHMTKEEHRLFVSSLGLRLNEYMEQGGAKLRKRMKKSVPFETRGKENKRI